MDKVIQSLEKLSRAIERITQVLLVLMGGFLVILTSFSIVIRYIFKTPLTWSYELSIICFLWVSFLGAALAFAKNGHISFEFFILKMPYRIRTKIFYIKEIVTFITVLLGTILGSIVCLNMFPQNYQTLPISLGWLYLALPIGFFFMTIHVLKGLLIHVHQRKLNRGIENRIIP